MANTSVVYARIDTELKESAEEILSQLGISPSSAIQMLYSQIVLKRGFPLDLHLSPSQPVAIGNMTRAQIDEELMKGIRSMEGGEKPPIKAERCLILRRHIQAAYHSIPSLQSPGNDR